MMNLLNVFMNKFFFKYNKFAQKKQQQQQENNFLYKVAIKIICIFTYYIIYIWLYIN